MTPRLTDEALSARMREFDWFHSIALRPGLTTAGMKSTEIMTGEEEALLGPFDLRGRSLLDIGAWNGYFSFAAKRRGAARVLATDDFTWRHPHYRGAESFDLVRAELELEVETAIIDPTLISGALGRFDVVLFLGVFYHLFDPIDVMQRLREVTGQLLLVETHQDLLGTEQPGMVFYPGTTLANDPTNWWGPNPAMMLRLLLQLGFTRVFYRDHPINRRGRGIFAAFTPEVEDSLILRLDDPWRDLDVPGGVADLVLRS